MVLIMIAGVASSLLSTLPSPLSLFTASRLLPFSLSFVIGLSESLLQLSQLLFQFLDNSSLQNANLFSFAGDFDHLPVLRSEGLDL